MYLTTTIPVICKMYDDNQTYILKQVAEIFLAFGAKGGTDK